MACGRQVALLEHPDPVSRGCVRHATIVFRKIFAQLPASQRTPVSRLPAGLAGLPPPSRRGFPETTQRLATPPSALQRIACPAGREVVPPLMTVATPRFVSMTG